MEVLPQSHKTRVTSPALTEPAGFGHLLPTPHWLAPCSVFIWGPAELGWGGMVPPSPHHGDQHLSPPCIPGAARDDQGPPGQLPALHLQHCQQGKPTEGLTGGFQVDQPPGPAGSIPRHHAGTRRGIAAGLTASAATHPPLDCNPVAVHCSTNSCGRLKSPNRVWPREAGTRSPLPTTPRLTLARDCFDSSCQAAEITAPSGDGRRKGCPVCQPARARLRLLLSLTRAKGLWRDGVGRRSPCQAGVPLRGGWQWPHCEHVALLSLGSCRG